MLRKYIFEKCLLIVLFFWFSISVISGQIYPNPQVRIELEKKMAEETAAYKRQREALQMQAMDRRINDRRSTTYRTRKSKIKAKDFDKIAISHEDISLYKDFLSQSKVGILRLHDANVCVQNKRQCPQSFSGKGSAYSFRQDVYLDENFADILFADSTFHLKSIGSLGFLTDLGNLPLEKLTLADKGVKELAEFEPSDKLEVIDKQYSIAQKGFQVGEFIYKTSLLLNENSTYVFRNIHYSFVKNTKNSLLKGDEDLRPNNGIDDLIVAFRVIRKYEDGSIILLWKILQSKDSPTVILK